MFCPSRILVKVFLLRPVTFRGKGIQPKGAKPKITLNWLFSLNSGKKDEVGTSYSNSMHTLSCCEEKTFSGFGQFLLKDIRCRLAEKVASLRQCVEIATDTYIIRKKIS